MEMIAANVARHKSFCERPGFVNNKKNGLKKKKRLGALSTEEITDNAVPVTTKKLQSSGRDYSTVRIRLVSLKSCKISNMNVEILRNHEDYVTTTIFT